jgi:hypothetical protein
MIALPAIPHAPTALDRVPTTHAHRDFMHRSVPIR